LLEVPRGWGRAIKRTAGCVAIILGAALAILGVVYTFDIGFGMVRMVCSPPFQADSSFGVLLAVAPIAHTGRLCVRNPSMDIGLLVIGFGLTLLLVGLLFITIGGLAVFGETIKGRASALRGGR
jgi:hypothetical protein